METSEADLGKESGSFFLQERKAGGEFCSEAIGVKSGWWTRGGLKRLIQCHWRID